MGLRRRDPEIRMDQDLESVSGRGDSTIFFSKNRVDITVWKTLWKV